MKNNMNTTKKHYYNLGRGIYLHTPKGIIHIGEYERRNGYPNAKYLANSVKEANKKVDLLALL